MANTWKKTEKIFENFQKRLGRSFEEIGNNFLKFRVIFRNILKNSKTILQKVRCNFKDISWNLRCNFGNFLEKIMKILLEIFQKY